MRISSFFYTIGQGFKNLGRNKWYTLASIATITACLFLFGLFYAITQQGYFKDKKQNISKGLQIDKKYFDKDGNETNLVKLGEEIKVKITVKTTDKKYVSNIVVTDLLPGGLSVVSGSLNGTFDSFDVREDRVLIYTSVSSESKEFSYEAKAVASGNFVLPAVEACHLYDLNRYAVSSDSVFKVNPRK